MPRLLCTRGFAETFSHMCWPEGVPQAKSVWDRGGLSHHPTVPHFSLWAWVAGPPDQQT